MRKIATIFSIERITKTSLIALATILLMIMFAPLAYKVPYFDDWYFAKEILSKGVFHFWSDFYFNWSGRYTSVFLLAITSDDPDSLFFKYMTVFIFISNVFFCSLVFHKNKWFNMTKQDSFVLSTVFFALYYANLPEQFSGLYWHCSIFYLLLPTNLALLVFSIQNYNYSKWNIAFVLCVIAFNAGMMELLIFMQCMILLWLVVYNWSSSQIRNHFSFFFFFSVVMGCINLFSPGNFGRSAVSSAASTEGFSIISTSFQTIYYFFVMDIGTVLMTKNALLLSISILLLMLGCAQRKVVAPKINTGTVILVMCSFIGVFVMLHFLFVAVAGYPMAGRVLNAVYFFWVILIVVFLYFILIQIESNFLKRDFKKIAQILLVVSLISEIFSSESRALIKSQIYELPAFTAQFDNLKSDIIEKGAGDNLSFQPNAFKLNYHPDTINDFNDKQYRSEMKSFLDFKYH